MYDVDGAENFLDFEPMTYGLQSTKIGYYKGVGYRAGLKKWITVDYVPTKKLIFLDLTKNYDTATNNRNQSITNAAVMALAIAAGGNISA
jgi:hypothetical protein